MKGFPAVMAPATTAGSPFQLDGEVIAQALAMNAASSIYFIGGITKSQRFAADAPLSPHKVFFSGWQQDQGWLFSWLLDQSDDLNVASIKFFKDQTYGVVHLYHST